jgi:hypothetical protein
VRIELRGDFKISPDQYYWFNPLTVLYLTKWESFAGRDAHPA